MRKLLPQAPANQPACRVWWAGGNVPVNLTRSVFLPIAFGAMSGSLPQAYLKRLGAIFAVQGEDKTCRWAVNGCPMFVSCRFATKDQWRRIREFAAAEVERRKALPVPPAAAQPKPRRKRR